MDTEAKKLIALKDELRKDMEALERVERLMASKNGSLSRPDSRQITLPVMDLILEEEDAEAPANSLRGTIEQIVNADTTTRWTTQKVLVRLQELRYPLRAQKPIYSVGQCLNILVKRGSIRLARKGAGNAPNIYKGKPVAFDLGAPSRGEGGALESSAVKE